MRFFVVLLALFSLTLSSCDRDQPTPKHTKAWLSQTDGDQLTFRNASTGATETLRARLDDVTHSRAGKFDFRSRDYQIITLAYARTAFPSVDLLELKFNGDGMVEMGATIASSFDRHAYVDTHKQAGKEFVYGTDWTDAEMLDNLQLNGRSYARVAHIRYKQGGWNMVAEYWYSKADGLIAYTQSDTGQTWYRVW